MNCRVALTLRSILCASVLPFVATGCKGDLEEKLAGALSSTVEVLTIGETNIDVTCRGSGEKLTIPTAELEMNALGLADIDKLTAVAQRIKNGCEDVARTRREAETTRRNLEDRAKEFKIPVDGKSNEDLQLAICQNLMKKLPLRGDKRTRMVIEHNQVYGCPDPGQPELPKWGFWEIDVEGSGKDQKVSLKLDSDDEGGERVDRFAVRCNGGNLDAYIASTEKFSSAPVKLLIDGKAHPVKPKVASDKKALLFSKDLKKLLPALMGKERMELTYKTVDKKTITRRYAITGYDAASKKLPKKCK